jgi:hypothetical protein
MRNYILLYVIDLLVDVFKCVTLQGPDSKRHRDSTVNAVLATGSIVTLHISKQ